MSPDSVLWLLWLVLWVLDVDEAEIDCSGGSVLHYLGLPKEPHSNDSSSVPMGSLRASPDVHRVAEVVADTLEEC